MGKSENYYKSLLEGVDRYQNTSKRDNFTASRNAFLNKTHTSYEDYEIAVYGRKVGTFTDKDIKGAS